MQQQRQYLRHQQQQQQQQQDRLHEEKKLNIGEHMKNEGGMTEVILIDDIEDLVSSPKPTSPAKTGEEKGMVAEESEDEEKEEEQQQQQHRQRCFH